MFWWWNFGAGGWCFCWFAWSLRGSEGKSLPARRGPQELAKMFFGNKTLMVKGNWIVDKKKEKEIKYLYRWVYIFPHRLYCINLQVYHPLKGLLKFFPSIYRVSPTTCSTLEFFQYLFCLSGPFSMPGAHRMLKRGSGK